MAHPLHLTLRNRFEDIPPANEAISQWMESAEAPPAADYLANLALEELVTNCVKYGYDDSAEHLIQVTLSLQDGELAMTVIDDGRAFNPLDLPPPDTTLAIEDRPIGGLGIHMLRQMSDRMEYERRDGKNHVTLRKRWPA
ncbi:MAG: hypothetical protein RJA22_2098 [Verrucomicrobiota bacterium]|jgi:anti-sigma regulatory factor (Ser/Thr protein kinase)